MKKINDSQIVKRRIGVQLFVTILSLLVTIIFVILVDKLEGGLRDSLGVVSVFVGILSMAAIITIWTSSEGIEASLRRIYGGSE